MRIGATFPQTELGGDPGAAQAFATGVEDLGYTHLVAYDHVLGADPAVHQGWSGAYDNATTFHEPLVFFGFLAAVTTDLELVTSIIILPQRQTALAAKQAAEVDLLSGGRLRFGVGLGWNQVEYEALGQDFTHRGRRLDEQIGLLRRLWTEPSVTFDGRYDHVTGAALAPRPARPIPIWVGGTSDAACRRIGRLADGWFPQLYPGEGFEEAKGKVDAAARDAGRDPAGIPFEGRVRWEPAGGSARVAEVSGSWEAAGASHLQVNTMGSDLETVDDHLAVLAEVATALGLSR